MIPSDPSSGDNANQLSAALHEALPYAEILEVGPVKEGVRGISAKAVVSIDGDPIKVFAKLNLRDEQCFQREAAAVLLLSFIDNAGLNLAKPVVTSEKPNLIVWRDLGDLQNLGDLLEGRDFGGAESALLALADALAQVHCSTRLLSSNAGPVLRERSRLECLMLGEGVDGLAVLKSWAASWQE